jgi:hypothetical protein
MRKNLPVVLIVVLALAVLATGCSLRKGNPTTTNPSGAATTSPSGLTTTTTPSDQATTTEATPTTTGATTSTLPAETTTTTIPSMDLSEKVSHEQNQPQFSYTGTWKTTKDASASGGSFAYANSSGSSVTIRLLGTRLVWIGKKSPAYGKAKVSVDGGAAHTVDLYSASTLWKQTIWSSGTLSAKVSHTVVISWTGKKRSAATGTNINVDAIEVTGVLTYRYQQNDGRLVYSGTWKSNSSSSASGQVFTFANASGASVTIKFTGIDLAWIAKKGPVYGKAKITVDGEKEYTVDLYSASVLWKKRVWSTGVIPAGTHTVVISWTGTKRAAATGTNINVDAFDVTGVLQ